MNAGGWVCTLLGLLFTLTGTAVAGRALRITWHTNANGQPLSPRWRRFRQWFDRWILRRQPETHHVTASAMALSMGLSGTVTAWTDPPKDATERQEIDYLMASVNELHERLMREADERTKGIRAAETKIRTAQAEAQQATHAVRELARQGAISTVPLQLRGLVLVGIGSVLSVLPAVFGWT